MADNNNTPSPERDLLKIIEGKNNDPSVTAKGSVRKGLSFFSLGALKGRLSFLKGQLSRVFSGGFSLDISNVNRILLVSLIAMFLFMSFDFVSSMVGLKGQVDAAFKVEGQIPGFSAKEASALKGPSFYLEKARKRDIFKMISEIAEEEESSSEGGKKEATKNVAKLTENLRLVGISWSDDPDAMIEDTSSKRTYFLKRGDSIGSVEVAGIFKDKVVLSYQGEEVELK
jgi:hypothetical protein